MEVSLCPLITICCSFSCFATCGRRSHRGCKAALLNELLSAPPTYVLGGGAGHLDPGFGEKGTGSQHEDDVNEGVDRVVQNRAERLRRREIVAESAYRIGAGWPA